MNGQQPTITLRPQSSSLEARVHEYMKPFHTATCREHLIGALQQFPYAPDFPWEESAVREQVALRLLQEVIVMGAQEQEALDGCLAVCGPLESLSACATTLQEIASRKEKRKKTKKKSSQVDSPSILETTLRTIRKWLVKGVSFPPDIDNDNYDERCWVEQLSTSLAQETHNYNHQKVNDDHDENEDNDNVLLADPNHPLLQACLENLTKLVLMLPVQISNACHALGVQLPTWAIASRYNPRLIEGALSMALYQEECRADMDTADDGYCCCSTAYFQKLVQRMVRNRNPDDVALGLYKYHERHFRNNGSNTQATTQQQQQPKALCQLLLQLHRHTLSSRESAYLLRSIMISSIPRQSHATEIATTQLTELWQKHLYPYMELSCRPILVASRKVREAFVRLLVLSPSSVLSEEWPDRLLCHCVASLLANPMPPPKKKKTRLVPLNASSDDDDDDDDDDSSTESSSSDTSSEEEEESSEDESIGDEETEGGDNAIKNHNVWLAKHIQEVVATWSMAVFVRQTDYRLQRHVTNFLLSGMCFLQLQQERALSSSVTQGTSGELAGDGVPAPHMSELVSSLLEGVTVRLQSSIPNIRKDGMMVAERLAQKMGQELQFEELDPERAGGDNTEDDEMTFLQSVVAASEFPTKYYTKASQPKSSNKRQQPRRQQQSRRPKQIIEEEEEDEEDEETIPESPKRKSKKTKKQKKKEQRRKQRELKRAGKSDTRILDAVYGHVNKKSSRRKHKPAQSYEDSYDVCHEDDGGDDGKEPSYDSSAERALPPKEQMRRFAQRQQRKEPFCYRRPRDHQSYTDSYDQSTTKLESLQPYEAPIQEGDVQVFETRPPPLPPQYHPGGQNNYYGSSLRQNPNYTPNTQHPQHQQYPSHQPFEQQQQQQQQQPYQQHFEQQQYQYQQHFEHAQQQQQQQQHVTFDNQDHVIPEPVQHERLLQQQYWENQVRQHRRQQQYFRQEAVQLQMNKARRKEQEGKALDQKKLEENVTMRIHSPRSPPFTRQEPKTAYSDPQQGKEARRASGENRHLEHVPSHRRPRPELNIVVDDVDTAEDEDAEEVYDEDEEEVYDGVEEQNSEDDNTTTGEYSEEEDEDEEGIAAFWTQQEVEMVLEDHLPGSPRRRPRSPQKASSSPRRHTGGAMKANSPSPRRHGSPRHTMTHKVVGSPREANQKTNSNLAQLLNSKQQKEVPALIFAMMDGENQEDVEITEQTEDAENERIRDVPSRLSKEKAKKRAEKIAATKLQMDSPTSLHLPYGKPPLSPRSGNQDRRKQRPSSSTTTTYMPPSEPSTFMPSTRSSKDGVGYRRHPHVDPAEIDARILAAAYDQESAASTGPDPSLSVYYSSSSEYSLYLGDPGQEEDSQRATRHLNHSSSKAYEYMKKKKRMRRGLPPEQPEDEEIPQRFSYPIVFDGRTPSNSNRHAMTVDPDATYVSDEEEDFDEEDYDDEDEYTRTSDYTGREDYSQDEQDYDDEDSVWEDSGQVHLNAYDLEDDEEDLQETARPLYLRDALELLRTPESDDRACSKQMSALKWLPHIIQGEERPADLPDLAVPLALELLRMENKFNIENFDNQKIIAAIALAVEEPLAVGQRLILFLWEDVALMDRLDVLTVLSEAAFELSGNKQLEDWQKAAAENKEKIKAGTYGKRQYVKENYSLLGCKDNSTDMGSTVSVHAERALGQVESQTRRWGRGRRRHETQSFRSRFGPVAHVWYYSLVGGFLQRKDNVALWGGATGARLLANLFVTLATIVECAGVAPGTDVLAKDLFELVWSFRTVDVAEVRMGVLVAVAASLACLSEEVVLTMMFDGSLSSLPEGLKQMAQGDPDNNCRRLAQSMSMGISNIVDSFQPMGKVSNLSVGGSSDRWR